METENSLKELLFFDVTKRVHSDDNSLNSLYGDVTRKIEEYIKTVKEEYVFIPKIKIESKDVNLPDIEGNQNLLIEIIHGVLNIMCNKAPSK